MTVRKRRWITRNGAAREAWIADYCDQGGDRHIETFDRRKDAVARHAEVIDGARKRRVSVIRGAIEQGVLTLGAYARKIIEASLDDAVLAGELMVHKTNAGISLLTAVEVRKRKRRRP